MAAYDPIAYALPRRLRLRALQDALEGDAVVGADETLPWERSLLDTFDGRLRAVGMSLEQRVAGPSLQLIWQSMTAAAVSAMHPTGPPPRFSADLPLGPIREALMPILGPRALLPQVSLRGKQRRVSLLTPSGEPVARIEIRKERLQRRRRTPLLASLRILAEPGQEVRTARLCERLVERLGLAPLPEGDGLSALNLGVPGPPVSSSKINLPLEPSLPAGTATRVVLQTLLATLRVNIPGVCDNLDSEFLHDFRVAVRRMRAALSQLRSTLSSHACEHYRVELAWLGQITSPARDLDVYLLDFDHCKGTLPTELQQFCEPLRPLLAESRDREYRLLGEVLRGERFKRLVARLAHLLGRPRKARGSGRDPDRPIGEVARTCIWSLYLEALAEAEALSPDSPLDQFHELRKTCKKLRYLMEFFVPLFPQQEIVSLIGALKQLQDNLGTIQDLRVQRESLSRFARQIEDRGLAQPRTLEAMAWLSDHQGELQRQAREEFRARFETFALENNRRRFQTLFAPAPRAVAEPEV